jgi:SEC-C motif-containing protein
MKNCYCCSALTYAACCAPVISGVQPATSAEQLMRSRYTAYAVAAIEYLILTTHPSKRAEFSKKEVEKWAKSNSWLRLEIVHASSFVVEFKAFFSNRRSPLQVHHERSTFVFEGGKWYYLDGVFNP